eukprot:CAMPEP_0196996696 /NCGR_PEP_ID=MMETSP1380-20130617/2508_1 /TAXON_ID=5936 /ORGANISM="Euplotes crassus, Strain CT5" /LENGTH=174 /DNA_ID=CAMNT_0042412739 /DNA_START=320 /DNA_END=844 /DNA_ORIENTATION=-
MYRFQLQRKETTKFKPVPQVVIDFMIDKHTGNWVKTTDQVNKRYSHSDGTMRTFSHAELKRSYDNEKKKRRRKNPKNDIKKKNYSRHTKDKNDRNTIVDSLKNPDKGDKKYNTSNIGRGKTIIPDGPEYDKSRRNSKDSTNDDDLPMKKNSSQMYELKFGQKDRDSDRSRGMFS